MPTAAGTSSQIVTASDPQAEQIAHLHVELGALEQRLLAAVAAGEAAADDALARGRDEGRAEAEASDRERLTMLGEGVERALAALDAQVNGERDLAIDITEAALVAIVGETIPYRAMVAATATRHAAALSQGAIVRLRVSAQDFADEAALATLSPLDRRAEVVADPSLASGACHFDLTLGALDASILTQIAAVGDLLDQARAA